MDPQTPSPYAPAISVIVAGSQDMSLQLQVIVVITVVVGVLAARWLRKPSLSKHLPPGPKPLPVIGNILDVPKSFPWLGFHDMCKQYGEYLTLNTSHSCSG